MLDGVVVVHQKVFSVWNLKVKFGGAMLDTYEIFVCCPTLQQWNSPVTQVKFAALP